MRPWQMLMADDVSSAIWGRLLWRLVDLKALPPNPMRIHEIEAIERAMQAIDCVDGDAARLVLWQHAQQLRREAFGRADERAAFLRRAAWHLDRAAETGG